MELYANYFSIGSHKRNAEYGHINLMVTSLEEHFGNFIAVLHLNVTEALRLIIPIDKYYRRQEFVPTVKNHKCTLK